MKKNNIVQGLKVKISKKDLNWDLFEPLFKLCFLLAAVLVIVITIKNKYIFHSNFPKLGILESYFFKYLFFLSLFIFIASLAFRTFLWFRYRPYNSKKIKKWPDVTVIVPAYNEGETIYKAIHSIVNNDYPESQLHIIAINDGSVDDTFSYMKKAQNRFPEMVEIINFSRNRGKRQGIYEAYKKSKLPEFTYTTQTVAQSIAQTLHQWIILFLLSVVFFVTAHTVFMKKDIG